MQGGPLDSASGKGSGMGCRVHHRDDDGRFPSARALKNDDEEEERRLFYVGATRARESLYLCYPVSSEDWNSIGFLLPSRFIRELPQDSFEEIAVEDV